MDLVGIMHVRFYSPLFETFAPLFPTQIYATRKEGVGSKRPIGSLKSYMEVSNVF